jgi:hypothetical protein
LSRATGGDCDPRTHLTSHRAIAALVLELRPDIGPAVVDSLVVEALDRAASDTLDESWARAREWLYPEAIAAAQGRFGISYARRRAAELRDAMPRAGDYTGRRRLRAVDGGDAA